MKKYLLILIILFLYCNIQVVYAVTVPTVGFLPGQIWYSKEPLEVDDTIKIHTAVFNNSDKPVSTRVEFYDKSTILGARDIIVSALSLKDISVPWKVTAGDHDISAKIVSSGNTSVTAVDHRSVSGIPGIDDSHVSSGTIIKKQLDIAKTDLRSIIPPSVSTAARSNFNATDTFRMAVATNIATNKDVTEKRIDMLNTPRSILENAQSNKKLLDVTEKPIAYIKLFLLSIASLIFSTQIVFYGLILITVFLILRICYRRIRNR